MKSVMTHQFSRVPNANVQRSTFDRSHGHKTTFDASWLIPIYVDEALPGDTFNLNMHAFARLATPLHPIMDNLYMDSFFFFVPNRLLWTNWEKFCGAQDSPGDSTVFTVPQITSPDVAGGGIAQGSLGDYMGLPTKPLNGGGATTGLTFNALHFRAYNLIWNTWFRDQNLQTPLTVSTGNGPDTYSNYGLRERGKRHDYFTSALPWPQKNNAGAVTIPLGTSANILTNPTNLITGVQSPALWRRADNSAPTAGRIWGASSGADSDKMVQGDTSLTNPGAASTAFYPSNLYADLSTATAATINTLRQSFQLQKMYERDARGGTRYTELLKAHFGVTSPDFRLQRPEYLGGGSQMVNINPVQGTNQVTVTTPQGNLAAYGTVGISGHGFVKSFVEHGVIIGLVSVRADLTYQQGVDRMWNRRTRLDYYWPVFQALGEQQIKNREIYANLADGTGAAQKDGVFGYQEAWAEYRYKPSKITGLFRSNATGTLDVWHLSQNFVAQPTLSDGFITEAVPLDRVIAVPAEPHFIFDSYFKLICARPMPVYSVPGMIDHF